MSVLKMTILINKKAYKMTVLQKAVLQNDPHNMAVLQNYSYKNGCPTKRVS